MSTSEELNPYKLRTYRCPIRHCPGALGQHRNAPLEATLRSCPDCRTDFVLVNLQVEGAGVQKLTAQTYLDESIAVIDHDTHWCVAIVGRIDTFAGERLEGLWKSLPNPLRVLCDLTQTTEVSPGGLEVLTRLCQLAEDVSLVLLPGSELLPAGAMPAKVAIRYDMHEAHSVFAPTPQNVRILVEPCPEQPPPQPAPVAAQPSPVTSSMPHQRRRRLEVEDIGDVAIVNFVDKKILDEQNIQMIGDDLFRLVDELGRRKVVLNFSNVEFMSSAALGKLITLHRKLRAVHGLLVVCNCSKDLLEIWQITKLDKILKVVPDEQTALQCF